MTKPSMLATTIAAVQFMLSGSACSDSNRDDAVSKDAAAIEQTGEDATVDASEVSDAETCGADNCPAEDASALMDSSTELTCARAVSDRVLEMGSSCSAGGTCIHFIGRGWSSSEAMQTCTNVGASTGSCFDERVFCARTTETACASGSGTKKMFVFSNTPGCGGVVVQRPAAGWPETYDTLALPEAGLPDASSAVDAATD